MYDPKFYMPMQSSIKLKINLPPEIGTMTVTPTSGSSLVTEFIIELVDFQDFNLPLSYQYMIYTCPEMNQLELKQDIDKFIDCRNIYSEPVLVNNFKTILPGGKFNNVTNKDEILIVVKVIDSLGGYTNVT